MKTSIVNNFLTLCILCLVGISLLISKESLALEVDSFQSDLIEINKSHRQFSYNIYQALIKSPHLQNKKFTTIEALSKAVRGEIKNNNTVQAITLIIKNKQLFSRYYDSKEAIVLVKLLLENNAIKHAEIIMSDIREQDDDKVNEQLHFLLTEYYFQQEDWTTVMTYLEEVSNYLSKEQSQHTLLMKGIVLQKQGLHNDSIVEYLKIPSASVHFTASQLNLALANIRLGWWTDAHRIIKNALRKERLKEQPIELTEQISDRFNITLGYSLLNQSFYRTARETFQLIGLKSRYSNQALLGIALSAAHQEDYIGALNATRYLKDIPEDDLPIDEGYLLMPFFYEKTQQLDTATIGYSEAEFYYQNKIANLTRLINSPLIIDKLSINENKKISIDINNTHINFSDSYPDYYFKQQQDFFDFSASVALLDNDNANNEFAILTQRYHKLTEKMAKSILKNRVSQLQSYLNQSRYGLARLYDNTTVEQ